MLATTKRLERRSLGGSTALLKAIAAVFIIWLVFVASKQLTTARSTGVTCCKTHSRPGNGHPPVVLICIILCCMQ